MNFRAIILAVLAMLFALPLFGAAYRRKISAVKHNSALYLDIKDIALFYNLTLKITKENVTMSSKTSKVVLIPDKRSGSINGVNVTWFFPMAKIKNKFYLSEYDFYKLLEPVMRPAMTPKKTVKTIMLDPGHGGTDHGAISKTGVAEKNMTYQMTMRLAKILAAKKYRVIVTRRTDKAVSLQQRVELVKKYKPDLFISIHCNAVANSAIKGVETFAATPQNTPSSSDAKVHKEKTAANSYDKQNTALAFLIQKALVKATKSNDRGVKHARFVVIKNAACPSVLVETGFITNSDECAQISSKAGQIKIVNAIANGIFNYIAVTAPIKKK